MYLIYALIVIALLGLAYFVRGLITAAKQKNRFKERLYKLTPNGRPLVAYNGLQYSTWAFTLFDNLNCDGVKRIEFLNLGELKLLVNKTCSITLKDQGQNEEPFDIIITRVMHTAKPSKYSEACAQDLWELAKTRLFMECPDLYVQLGSKVPKGITREEFKRLYTLCYATSEVWDALQVDILQAIQSRM